VVGGLRGVRGCRVRGLSSKGAGLQLHETALLPTEFKISFDGLHHTFGCRLIWRHRDFVGIEFKLW
jgi:hypothetical protein